MSRSEMERLGWETCDVVLVTGDAYVDHPSFGAALIGRALEAEGFRVGIIAQPCWRSVEPYRALGRPRLFFGVTAGNMDSMVNLYTSDGRLRSDDAYSPHGAGGRRPERAVIVYSQRVREAYKDSPIIIGGIEASLRRLAHYDYWSNKIRRSILLDSRADLLLFGNAEKAVVQVARHLDRGGNVGELDHLRGTAYVRSPFGGGGEETASPIVAGAFDGEREPSTGGLSGAASGPVTRCAEPVRLPSFQSVSSEPAALAEATRLTYQESSPFNGRPLVQSHGDKDVWVNPPPLPLSTEELDSLYDLPFARAPHPSYSGARIPAWEMIRFSVSITRGCFGGCSFCAISLHEGRTVQSRSRASVLRELDLVRDLTAGFTGVISDLGGPTANMYGMRCGDEKAREACRRLSCIYPRVCSRLSADHGPLIKLYRAARQRPGIRKVLVASGLRYDLALLSTEYIEELVTHHVGGLLKVAPEHSEEGPLSSMMKPGIDAFERFRELFDAISSKAGKVQHLIPYFIAAHPGTTDEDMVNLAIWLKNNGFRVDQVQTFLPTPATLSTAMFHAELDPLYSASGAKASNLHVPKGLRQRRLQKALLRYHDPKEWPLIRAGLRDMGREELIGDGPVCLVPGRGSKPHRSTRRLKVR